MRLDALLDGLEVIDTRGDPATTDVTAVTHDSRAVVRGALFCCVPGGRADGHEFAGDAVGNGASALLVERVLPLDVTQAQVSDARAAMGPVAAAFWGHPSRDIAVVGVTGTNGKTTTVHLLQAVLEAAGRATAVIGTLTGARTTPEATELQAALAAQRAEGKQAVAMEVSSHALALERVRGTRFAVSVFTNLGVDHLDFHGDVDSYFEAKARLFTPELSDQGVVNADDRYGQALLERAAIPLRSFSLADADALATGVAGSTFRWRGRPVALRLGGVFNVANALAAATAASALGVDDGTVADGLAAAGPVPGRFEAVDEGQPYAVVVDYAHTPDGLEQVLGAARQAVAPGSRVLVVFGCGGDRDRSKRPLMGEVATRLADHVFLTSDNSRSEDPAAIAAQVMEGVRANERLVLELDRRAAIALALADARPGDVVIVAGKGHETGQTIGDDTRPFDDRVVVREELARR